MAHMEMERAMMPPTVDIDLFASYACELKIFQQQVPTVHRWLHVISPPGGGDAEAGGGDKLGSWHEVAGG